MMTKRTFTDDLKRAGATAVAGLPALAPYKALEGFRGEDRAFKYTQDARGEEGPLTTAVYAVEETVLQPVFWGARLLGMGSIGLGKLYHAAGSRRAASQN